MSKFVIEKCDYLDAAARNLNDLLDVICEIQLGKNANSVDRRVDSLLWIARDMSEGIVATMTNDAPEPVMPVAEYLNELVIQAGSETDLIAEIDELYEKAKVLRASFRSSATPTAGGDV